MAEESDGQLNLSGTSPPHIDPIHPLPLFCVWCREIPFLYLRANGEEEEALRLERNNLSRIQKISPHPESIGERKKKTKRTENFVLHLEKAATHITLAN